MGQLKLRLEVAGFVHFFAQIKKQHIDPSLV